MLKEKNQYNLEENKKMTIHIFLSRIDIFLLKLHVFYEIINKIITESFNKIIILICLKISHSKHDKVFKLIIFKLIHAVFLQQKQVPKSQHIYGTLLDPLSKIHINHQLK